MIRLVTKQRRLSISALGVFLKLPGLFVHPRRPTKRTNYFKITLNGGRTVLLGRWAVAVQVAEEA